MAWPDKVLGTVWLGLGLGVARLLESRYSSLAGRMQSTPSFLQRGTL